MSTPPEDPSPLTCAVWDMLAARLAERPSPEGLAAMLRHLAKWRSEVLANTLVARDGAVVQTGPFKGMRYPVRAAEGARAPRLLGSYETTLWPVIEAIIASSPALVVDVGAAEGYYAVGLARALPDAEVHAHDTDPRAQALCTALARENGVEARVAVGGTLTHAGFDLCAARKTVVICDIEGDEATLLDPVRAPGLRDADILVEVHEGVHPGLGDDLTARFAATHRVTRLESRLVGAALPDWLERLSDLDRLIAQWEWRAAPTPWLWMERR